MRAVVSCLSPGQDYTLEELPPQTGLQGAKIVLFPNPTSDLLTIQLAEEFQQLDRITGRPRRSGWQSGRRSSVLRRARRRFSFWTGSRFALFGGRVNRLWPDRRLPGRVCRDESGPWPVPGKPSPGDRTRWKLSQSLQPRHNRSLQSAGRRRR